MRRRLLVALATLLAAACGQPASKAEAPAGQATAHDTLTRRQKDSILSTLPLPGASKIGEAQRATDRINARVQAFDTVR